MKKVLVTGACGSIGMKVIKALLMEGKYEITALDLKNRKNIKKIKKYKSRINIIYGDILDYDVVKEAVKGQDYIIHLAGLLPPMADFSQKLGEIIEYEGTLNIIEALNECDSQAFLVYASTTSLYDFSLTADTNEKIKESILTSFSLSKYKTEKLIKTKLKNYTILRLPLVLTEIKNESFIYNVPKNVVVEVTTSLDASGAFVLSLKHQDELNKKIFNVGMGEKGRVIYKDILNNVKRYYGFSFKYLMGRMFLEKSYNSPILNDSDNLENILHYRHDTLINYYRRLKTRGKYRIIPKILARPFVRKRK